MNLNDYLRNELMDHINNLSWTPPVTLYMALLKSASASSDTPVANAAKEVQLSAVDGYARQAITFGNVAVGGLIDNTVAVTFGPASADWPEAVDAWILDTATFASGNILWQGVLLAPKTVEDLGSMVFPIGDLDLSLS